MCQKVGVRVALDILISAACDIACEWKLQLAGIL